MRRLILIAITALALASTASAATTYTYKLAPGWTQARFERTMTRSVNRTSGISDADCWLYGGNAKTVWRHIACVGTYSESNTGGRFKLTFTPISCSKMRAVTTAPGEKTDTRIWPWPNKAAVLCGVSP